MRPLAFLVALSLLVPALPLHAAEPEAAAAKDPCLMDNRNCPGNTNYTLVEKIARLRTAIENKDSGTYTPQELERLGKRLEECLEIADLLEIPETTIPR